MAALLLLTLLSLSTVILSLAENINIDCGASESYVDSDNIKWLDDSGLFTTSESFEIPGKIPQPFNKLRSFPSGESNCYTIPATKGGKTLVRTMFYYGNYDNKNSPPSFTVVYDGKLLERVVTEAAPVISSSEVIFAPASEKISVCLRRTSPSDVPFISSIEVYSLDAGMYKDLGLNESLILRQRFAYGAEEIISYPSDPYGRLWFPFMSDDSRIKELTTSAGLIDITGASNKPPEIVMSKALSADSFFLSDKTLPSAGIPVYLALYFSEPQRLDQTRSFNVSLDTKQVGPIVPAFGEASQVVIRDVVATSDSQVVFQSTADSKFPPIINAIELYSISYDRYGGDNGGGESGGGGEGETGSSNDMNSEVIDSEGKKTRKNNARPSLSYNAVAGTVKKNRKLPLIIGVSLASAFGIIVTAVCSIKRPQPEANTLPTTSTLTGTSPLAGQQLASDASQPGLNEPGVYDIDGPTKVSK
ncbi:hypothetical protein V5N11_007775 [Cardamine amara subsp. amara]|uniref:Malectin-like domain-containing protein n=1 Tax=Cardamine amara subsp. amara TaxID=228776 RepID=A0ABD1B868_CARAN